MPICKFSKILLFSLSLLVFFVFPLSSFAQYNNTTEEIMTFETYYPAPFGVYNEMRAKKMAIGDNYYNGSQYCWSGTCSNPINATTNLVVEGDVSIGTANPIASSARQLYIYGSNSSGGGAYITLDSTTGYGAAPIIDFIRGGDYANRWEMGNDLAAAGGADNNFFIYTGRGGGRVLSLTPSGNVGIGTTAPGTKLHVLKSGSGDVNTWNEAARFDTSNLTDPNPYITVGERTSGGGGTLAYQKGAVGGGKWHLWHHTEPNSVITAQQNGNVGIGTASPAGHLTVRGTGTDANGFLRLENTAGYSSSIYLMANNELRFNLNDGSSVGYLTSAGWGFASDRALKKDIVEMSKYGLDTVMLMHPREYRMKADNSSQIGFIAQEMQALIPEVVSGEEGQLGIVYGNLAAVLTRAIQEQQRQIEELRSEIEKLRAK